MKKIWSFLIFAVFLVGAAYAVDNPIVLAEEAVLYLSPIPIDFDLEGIEVSASDLGAIQGEGPRYLGEDGDRGYYRPGTEVYDPEPSELLKDNAKATLHVVVDIVDCVSDLVGYVRGLAVKGVHRLIDEL